MKKQNLGLFLLLFVSSAVFSQPARPLALVYNGIGACEEGCAKAAAEVAVAAGYRVRYVQQFQPQTVQLLAEATVWIQPGGDAIQVAQNLGSAGLDFLRRRIYQGMAYVGFCAGAFLADSTVDDPKTIPGLGLFPGETYDYDTVNRKPQMINVFWRGGGRSLYFEDGPAFTLTDAKRVNVLAVYQNGAPAVITTTYGNGPVALSGPHPEAMDAWKTRAGLIDTDGDDRYLAVQLLQAAGQTVLSRTEAARRRR